MPTLLEEPKPRPTRDECIQDAGAAWARIRQMYTIAPAVIEEDAA